jgi:hypothetical protein
VVLVETRYTRRRDGNQGPSWSLSYNQTNKIEGEMKKLEKEFGLQIKQISLIKYL